MRILVYPHDLGMGGSQLNAIQLASAVRDFGHDVVVYGQPGPLVETIAAYGLEFVPAPVPARRPSPSVVRHLHTTIAQRRIDVVHGYEWPPILEAELACRRSDARATGTVLSMSVAPFIPHWTPLAVGTEQIAAAERLAGRQAVHVIEPPVDLTVDDPALVDVTRFRAEHGIAADEVLVAVVSRLAAELKLEGILTAVDVVGELSALHPVRLLVAGDGPARDQVEQVARRVNHLRGREVIRLTGNLADPRPAYAAADVVLGMGGSALRAMAYARTLVVQGENGFWELLDERTAPLFLWTGWYGHGPGKELGAARLRVVLGELLGAPERRTALGALGRKLVEDRFALPVVAARQHEIYHQVATAVPPPSTLAAGRAAGGWVRYQAGKRVRRLGGRAATDDFNARPVAGQVGASVPEPASGGDAALASQDALLYFAGVSWDAVKGTDRHLAEEISRHRPVVWVDPPTSVLRALRGRQRAPRLTQVGPGLLRVHPVSPPGVSRPGLRGVAHALAARAGLAAVGAWGKRLGAVVVSSPLQLAPRVGDAVPVAYFETDDFVAGADLFGVDRSYLERRRAGNLARAGVVLAVTEELARRLGDQAGLRWVALPNGCRPPSEESVEAVLLHLPAPRAGVVGQLNDRLDLALLEGVAATGASLVLVGPRRGLRGDGDARLDALVSRANVEWVGEQPPDSLPGYLAALDVGLTPYADSDFNRSSFPLKTLEYLAAGLPVVTTALPAAFQLRTPLVTIATDDDDFVARTLDHLERPGGADEGAQRRAFAAEHTWASRARILLTALGEVASR